MRIVMPGGSGHVGGMLSRAFLSAGHEVVVLSRSGLARDGERTVRWDGRSPGSWADEIDGADVVVNLAGRSVSCRYNKRNLTDMYWSRVHATEAVGAAIARAHNPPPLWLQASTATIYAHTSGPPHGEDGALGGNEPGVPPYWAFSIAIARAWEAALDASPTPHTRKVAMRSAMVMGPGPGGAFNHLAWLARTGLGGPIAGGRQYMSWVHEDDFTRAVSFLIGREDMTGPVNIAAPNPLTQREFMAELRGAFGVPVGMPATAAMVRLGMFVVGSDPELIMKSRRVVPERLVDAGFEVAWPHWSAAARDLAARMRWDRRSPSFRAEASLRPD